MPSLAASALYWWLIRRIGVTSLNAPLFAVAPTTAVAGTLLLVEPFSAVTGVGFAVSAIAVALVLVSERARPESSAATTA